MCLKLGEIRLRPVDGVALTRADWFGGGAKVLFAQVTTGLAMTNAEFNIIGRGDA